MEITPITFHYLFDVNCYLLKTSGGFFLVDTGLQKRQGSLDEALLTAGCHPGDLKLIILTHGHTDHIGNAGHIRERFDAKIAMHIGDARMAETGNMFIDANGVKEIVAGYLTRMLGLSAPRFTADVPLEDDQDLSPYGLAARVIHTPGHSAGSICILTTEGDILSGDLYDNT